MTDKAKYEKREIAQAQARLLELDQSGKSDTNAGKRKLVEKLNEGAHIAGVKSVIRGDYGAGFYYLARDKYRQQLDKAKPNYEMLANEIFNMWAQLECMIPRGAAWATFRDWAKEEPTWTEPLHNLLMVTVKEAFEEEEYE